jgi:O-succinylbenzoic acid--CoA ligase
MPEVHGLPDFVDDNVGLVVESSGSTGRPKRIELSTDALLASARASLDRLGGPGQWLLALPANYIAGAQVLIRSLVADTQPILMNTGVSFTVEAFVRAASLMTGERKYTSIVPTQLNALAAAAGGDDTVLYALRSFDAILVGGQAPSASTVSFLRELGVNLVVTYGMTETAGGCVYDGVALAGVKVKLGESGEILLGGITMANGIGDWFATADLGLIDDAGRLKVLGRRDRVINSGAVKLSLDLVEEWARSQPGVRDAVSLPVQHPKFGDSFICWVVVDDIDGIEIDHTLASVELGLAARTAIWANLAALPTLPNGKPDLQELQRSFLEFQKQQRDLRDGTET